MSWQSIGPAGAALGALVLAGVLLLLQRLRVRHQERTVVTTLFWQQAVEEARARVLVERFRHPLAYLLLLALALATWLAAAGPRATEAGTRDQVLLLDGSAGMAGGERFEAALESLRQAAAAAPRDGTTVLWCGAEVRALLLPGEDPLLLDARLEGRSPEAAPASVERAVWDLVQGERERGLALRVFGDAPVRAGLVERLPEDVDLARVELDGEAGPSQAAALALGVTAARSGAWDRVDVLAQLRDAGQVTADLDGVAVSARREGEALLLEDLPAEGGRLTLRAGEATWELVLPERRHLRVVTGGTLPGPLLACLRADPAVRLVSGEEEADVCFRRRGEAVGAGLPTFELVPAADQDQAFLFTSPSDDPERALVAGVLELGLDRVDATALAESTGVVITAGAELGDVRGFAVWEELLGPGYDLVEGRAFPLLVGRAVRWLGGVTEHPAVVAAGEPVSVPLLDLASVGLDPIPPVVGSYRTAAGGELAAALLVRDDPDAAALGTADVGGGLDLVLLLTALALALALAEGWLFRTGRMP